MSCLFTDGTLFGRHGILELAKRPWISADAMDHDLVDVWTGVVRPRDTAWHPGDFAIGQKVTADRCRRIFAALNGEKHLVQGNHDVENAEVLGLGWASTALHDKSAGGRLRSRAATPRSGMRPARPVRSKHDVPRSAYAT